MWFTISSQLEVFVADQLPAAGAVGTLGFDGGQQCSRTPVVLSTVLRKGFCPPLRPVPKVAIPPSLWCSGLRRVCPLPLLPKQGCQRGLPGHPSWQKLQQHSHLPCFSGDAQLPWDLCTESLSGVGPAWAQGDPAQAFCSFPGRACVGSSFHPSALPVPLSSLCIISPEITFPSGLEVEQEMTSQLSIRHSSWELGLHPT